MRAGRNPFPVSSRNQMSVLPPLTPAPPPPPPSGRRPAPLNSSSSVSAHKSKLLAESPSSVTTGVVLESATQMSIQTQIQSSFSSMSISALGSSSASLSINSNANGGVSSGGGGGSGKSWLAAAATRPKSSVTGNGHVLHRTYHFSYIIRRTNNNNNNAANNNSNNNNNTFNNSNNINIANGTSNNNANNISQHDLSLSTGNSNVSSSAVKHQAHDEYAAQVRSVASIGTVEEFWGVYVHLHRVSKLRQSVDYVLFQDGIRPLWEDEANRLGGRLCLRVLKAASARAFEDLCLALIGEQFDTDDICGVACGVRMHDALLSIWLRDRRDVELIEKVEAIARRLVDVPGEAVVRDWTFKAHMVVDQHQQSTTSAHGLGHGHGYGHGVGGGLHQQDSYPGQFGGGQHHGYHGHQAHSHHGHGHHGHHHGHSHQMGYANGGMLTPFSSSEAFVQSSSTTTQTDKKS